MAISTTALLLIVVLVVLAIGAAPSWRYSRSWGYWPSGTVGTLVLVVVLFGVLGYV